MVVERQWMRWFFFFVTTLILNLPLLSRAETTDHGGSSTSTRAITAEKLSDDVVRFISEHFGLPEGYVRSRFEPSLPRAIEALKSGGDETAIATEIAFLMGRVNDTQIDKLAIDAKQVADAEEAKADEGKDARKIDLMKRLLWAAKIRQGSPSTADGAAKFQEKFDPEFRKVEEKNKEIIEKIKQASSPAGNAEASKWLRENLSGEALASFVEAQRKTGNTSLSDEIMFGIATRLPNGQRFVDFHGTDGQGERLFLGNSVQTTSTAVNKLFENNESKGKGRGFGGSLTTGADHQFDPPRIWHVNAAGEFKTGNPEGVQGNPQPSPQPPPQAVVDDGQAKFQEFKAFISATCSACHNSSISVSGTTLQNAQITKGTRGPRSIRDILAAVKNNGSMMSQVDASVVRSLESWAAQAGQ